MYTEQMLALIVLIALRNLAEFPRSRFPSSGFPLSEVHILGLHQDLASTFACILDESVVVEE